MSETHTQYAIGADVRCADGACGHLERVVVDPVGRTLTHLVVEADDGATRLVPVDLVDEGGATAAPDVRLRCGTTEFAALETAEVTEFLPATEGGLGYSADQMMAWPYYGLGAGMAGRVAPAALAFGTEPVTATYDRVPSGEVQIRRGERVEATDGEIGKVQGLVIDPQDHGVTHVLLQEGHLWGKKTVAIPIREVTDVKSEKGNVRVNLTKEELGYLPPIDINTQT